MTSKSRLIRSSKARYLRGWYVAITSVLAVTFVAWWVGLDEQIFLPFEIMLFVVRAQFVSTWRENYFLPSRGRASLSHPEHNRSSRDGKQLLVYGMWRAEMIKSPPTGIAWLVTRIVYGNWEKRAY